MQRDIRSLKTLGRVRQEWYWDLTLPLAHRMLCDFISWSMFQTRLIVLLSVDLLSIAPYLNREHI